MKIRVSKNKSNIEQMKSQEQNKTHSKNRDEIATRRIIVEEQNKSNLKSRTKLIARIEMKSQQNRKEKNDETLESHHKNRKRRTLDCDIAKQRRNFEKKKS